jgi:aminoglycoside 2''-phosphotransferase
MEPSQLLALIETETPVEVKKHRFIHEGWDNMVVEVNDTMIFRFTRRDEVKSQFLKEIELLPLLSDNLTVSVPKPIYTQTDSTPCFMGYKKIEGIQLKSYHVNNYLENVSSSIGNFLSELHRVKGEGLSRIEYYDPSSWKAQYQLLYDRIEKELSERFNTRIWRRIQYVFKTYLGNPENFIFEPVLCHRDLSGEHILHVIGSLTGVIDWGDACFGDPAFDLTGLYADFGRSFAENICRRVELPASYLDRCEFYVMVIPFYEALYGLDTGKTDRFENGLARVKSVFG